MLLFNQPSFRPFSIDRVAAEALIALYVGVGAYRAPGDADQRRGAGT
jgi:hypothetical protein